ncbi:radical SAM protein [Desulfobacter curvatus]|uniref:radical SAM protein n=1 Tax=Desulfobacter curvatus TaxID=2290 RepID=UPI00036BF769|nr:radical SAM protein [Desulfobacter curvatus]
MPNRSGTADELFLIPYTDGKYCLYAPLQRTTAIINATAAHVISKYLETGEKGLTSKEIGIIHQLKDGGLFGNEMPEPPLFPDNYTFCPHEVTLFLTSRCNLRCRYCYADAGYKSIDMPWEVAKAAIDLCADNAGLLGSRAFAVGFHGGGEPTVAWRMMVRCVEYAKEKAESKGLDVEIFSATNGFLSLHQREYMAKHFTNINVSLDGPKSIQDYNRPTLDNRGSFDQVRDTLRYFDNAGLKYGIRSTITKASVHRMVEIVESLHHQFNFMYLQLEPVWHCGRCITSEEPPPLDEDFITNFIKAFKRGQELGIQVTYSGARLDTLTSKFCAAPGDGFTVLPEGIVTSCYEVLEPTDPKASIFHYGQYNPLTNTFDFDAYRISKLRDLTVNNLAFCKDCFCKWHCAGDCLSKAFEVSKSTIHQGTNRCTINRALTLAWLKMTIEKEDIQPRDTGENDARQTR